MKIMATVISDTHTKHKDIIMPKLKTDKNIKNVLIHCGDFSHTPQQVFSFCKWYGDVPGYDYRLLIAGNHDEYVQTVGYETFKGYCEDKGIIYLQDTSVTIEGIKFHGSPWTPEYGHWAFMLDEFELDGVAWNRIPDDVQVLITHGPAKGVGDSLEGYQDITDTNVGSSTLAYTINNRLKNMTHHFFGHIHEAGYEVYNEENYIACNATCYDFYEREVRKPYTFEIKAK